MSFILLSSGWRKTKNKNRLSTCQYNFNSTTNHWLRSVDTVESMPFNHFQQNILMLVELGFTETAVLG